MVGRHVQATENRQVFSNHVGDGQVTACLSGSDMYVYSLKSLYEGTDYMWARKDHRIWLMPSRSRPR
jgi:hypothetical protein